MENCRSKYSKDMNTALKKIEKDKESGMSEDELKRFEAEVQTLTDKTIKELDELLAKKKRKLQRYKQVKAKRLSSERISIFFIALLFILDRSNIAWIEDRFREFFFSFYFFSIFS